MLEPEKLKLLLEAILLAAGKPMTEDQLLAIFSEDEKPEKEVLKKALEELRSESENRGVELIKVASGYRFQIKLEWAPWVGKLWEEKAQKYSRALLETLALIAYRQPITRGEIEDIRGVAVSTSIIKTLLEDREWVRIVGHKEVPGRPALYATTKGFLDYFGLNHLQDLPSLPDIMNLDTMDVDLDEAVKRMGAEERIEASAQMTEEEELEEMEKNHSLKVEMIDVET